ncbi:MAG: Rne/Rng family ribonuclease [Deltaproteobacteria bacterium]|nr:MAG: Rne/Rng family ribonuclease [Deltaproteobacteria bacterium]
MARLLLVNRRPDQRRVALIDNGVTTELFFERLRERSIVGNIYAGRVVRVLRGMQAAFVEVGLQRTGFLFVGDVARPDGPDLGVDAEGDGDVPPPGAEVGRGDRYPPITELLAQGQQVLVQVAKAPMGTKGARLTTHISLPGRHLVYMPTVDHLGVSRRIKDPVERARLKAILERLKPAVGGLILRTAGEGLDEAEFKDDVAFLEQLWADIQKRGQVVRPPELVHEDVDLTLRSVRDLIQSEDDRVVVDDDAELERIVRFVQRFMPTFEANIQRWDSADPMFERYGVEWEITRASRRKVWLKSGGYILIDRTEALTAIDVNTGRYVGKSNFEETIVEINLEAVREIAYQLRLRDIGGIIVIDFIDMELEANQQRVTAALAEELAKDRARTKVLPISGLGLVEMTRKRVRNSIVQDLTEPCFYCEGKGYLQSLRVIADSIIMNLHQSLRGAETGTVAEVQAQSRITELLVEEYGDELAKIEKAYGARVDVVDKPAMHIERFTVRVV